MIGSIQLMDNKYEFDVVIIGAGIIRLAIAEKLDNQWRNSYLLHYLL